MSTTCSSWAQSVSPHTCGGLAGGTAAMSYGDWWGDGGYSGGVSLGGRPGLGLTFLYQSMKASASARVITQKRPMFSAFSFLASM